jgi:hypothetical protein
MINPTKENTMTQPGYYPDNQGTMRWWTGRDWSEYTQYQQPAQPQAIQINNSVGRTGVSTISRGEHIFHLVMTICTAGLWLLVWIPRALFARRRMS